MKKVWLALSILMLISIISAQCNETQIDINSASVEELDNLTGVGPVIAQNIINSRPFNSVDDLINVSRIGNKTLEKIKQQGLACVSSGREVTYYQDSSINSTTNLSEDNSTALDTQNSQTQAGADTGDENIVPKKTVVGPVIDLNSALHEFNTYFRAL